MEYPSLQEYAETVWDNPEFEDVTEEEILQAYIEITAKPQGILEDTVDKVQEGALRGVGDTISMIERGTDSERGSFGSKYFDEWADEQKETISPQMQREEAAFDPFDISTFTPRALASIGGSGLGSVGANMLGGGVAGAGLKAIGKRALKKYLGKAAIKKKGKESVKKLGDKLDEAAGVTGFGMAGGAMVGGSVGNEVEDTIMNPDKVSIDQLKENEDFLRIRSTVDSDMEARYKFARAQASQAANLAAISNAPLSMISGKLLRGLVKPVKGKVLDTIARTGAETVEEGAQGSLEAWIAKEHIPGGAGIDIARRGATEAIGGTLSSGSINTATRSIQKLKEITTHSGDSVFDRSPLEYMGLGGDTKSPIRDTDSKEEFIYDIDTANVALKNARGEPLTTDDVNLFSSMPVEEQSKSWKAARSKDEAAKQQMLDEMQARVDSLSSNDSTGSAPKSAGAVEPTYSAIRANIENQIPLSDMQKQILESMPSADDRFVMFDAGSTAEQLSFFGNPAMSDFFGKNEEGFGTQSPLVSEIEQRDVGQFVSKVDEDGDSTRTEASIMPDPQVKYIMTGDRDGKDFWLNQKKLDPSSPLDSTADKKLEEIKDSDKRDFEKISLSEAVIESNKGLSEEIVHKIADSKARRVIETRNNADVQELVERLYEEGGPFAVLDKFDAFRQTDKINPESDKTETFDAADLSGFGVDSRIEEKEFGIPTGETLKKSNALIRRVNLRGDRRRQTRLDQGYLPLEMKEGHKGPQQVLNLPRALKVRKSQMRKSNPKASDKEALASVLSEFADRLDFSLTGKGKKSLGYLMHAAGKIKYDSEGKPEGTPLMSLLGNTEQQKEFFTRMLGDKDTIRLPKEKVSMEEQLEAKEALQADSLTDADRMGEKHAELLDTRAALEAERPTDYKDISEADMGQQTQNETYVPTELIRDKDVAKKFLKRYPKKPKTVKALNKDIIIDEEGTTAEQKQNELDKRIKNCEDILNRKCFG